MGIYLNPGNSGFTGIRNDIYVDKNGLISLVNETIETPDLRQQTTPFRQILRGADAVRLL